MRRSIVLLLFVFAGVAAVWLATRERPASAGSVVGPQAAAAEERVGAAPATAELVGTSVGGTDAAAPPAREAVAAAAPAAASGALATLRGRCVDQAGQPMAGVAVRMNSGLHRTEAAERWLLEHEAPPPLREKRTTGEDGRFEFSFAPQPPLVFSLGLSKEGLVGMSGTWREVAPGSTIDVGDVALLGGTRISGSVREPDGTPLSGVWLHVAADSARPPGLTPWRVGQAKVEAGGFVCRQPLPPGSYTVEVDGREVERPKQISIEPGQSDLRLDVVVVARDPRRLLRGVVVDELGQPIAGARVMTYGQGPMSSANTGRDGRFELFETSGDLAPVRLISSADGHDDLQTSEAFAWGRDDLRLTMRSGAGLELLVVEAGSNAPVEEFGVRVIPQPGSKLTWGSNDLRVRASGRHPGGRVLLPKLQSGAHHVIVEPKQPDLAASTFVPVTIDARARVTLTIALARRIDREVRVVMAGGEPVAGTTVQLVDTLGVTLEPGIRVHPVAAWLHTSGLPKVCLLQELTTDADGKGMLRGPASGTLGLVLRGRSHPPTVVRDVVLGVAEPLVVEVEPAARLEGRLIPVEVLADLRVRAGLPAQGDLQVGRASWLPGLRLQRTDPKPQEGFPPQGDPAIQIAADGSFAIDGVPPGRWTVQLHSMVQVGRGGGFGAVDRLGEVELRAGGTTKVELDVAHLRHGGLTGVALHNGLPLAGATLQCLRAAGPSVQAMTGADGRFELRLQQGEYTVRWILNARQGASLRAAEKLTIQAGDSIEQTIQFQSGELRFRLRDSEDKPVAGVAIELVDSAGQARRSLPATDPSGSTTAIIEPETYVLRVLPKRLLDPEAQRKVWAERTPDVQDPFARHRIPLGSVTVQVGQTTERELRLPAEWGQ